jgi:hypothetical protein
MPILRSIGDIELDLVNQPKKSHQPSSQLWQAQVQLSRGMFLVLRKMSHVQGNAINFSQPWKCELRAGLVI